MSSAKHHGAVAQTASCPRIVPECLTPTLRGADGGLIAWTSADGDGWVRHWLPGATFGGGTPDQIVGGRFGYLALGWTTDPATRPMKEGLSFPRALWSSNDGAA